MIIFMTRKIGEVIYRYRKPDDKDVLINDWIIIKTK